MTRARAPFLQSVQTRSEGVEPGQFPFTIPAFSQPLDLAFARPVTFFVGENGSGKSTLLEALAEGCGFNPEGGSRDHQRETTAGRSPLLAALRLTWKPKVTRGFFLRAESFYNFATYIEGVSDMQAYGGKSLHAQSHGESFLALFTHRFDQGVFILDEPEAALSPQRQLSFLKIVHDLTARGGAQFVIATHSPITLAYPGAVLFSLDGDTIQTTDHRDTKHFRLKPEATRTKKEAPGLAGLGASVCLDRSRSSS